MKLLRTIRPAAVPILCLWLGGVAAAADTAMPVPVAVAASDAFEAVGRLGDEGLVFYVDRADSNAPVLAARLEVELAGKTAQAVFQPAQGTYLVSDEAWLQALRRPGHYPLGLTLLAGEESDLLSAEIEIASAGAPETGATHPAIRAGAALAVLLLAVLGWRWRKGART